MPKSEWKSRTKHDLTIEVWEALDCESVGARELEQIQQAIRERFGDGAVESPALIARTLADEGAVLRHPEVLDCDTAWRRQRLAGPLDQLLFATLDQASDSIRKLELHRAKLARDGDETGLQRLQEMTLALKQEVQLIARSEMAEQRKRSEAREINDWLGVWLRSPELFDDWLGLRQRSPEFVKKFQR
jgi:hypothetical protein